MSSRNDNSHIAPLDIINRVAHILFLDAAASFLGGLILLVTPMISDLSVGTVVPLLQVVGSLGILAGLFALKLAQDFSAMKRWSYNAAAFFIWTWWWFSRDLYTDPVRQIFDQPDPGQLDEF